MAFYWLLEHSGDLLPGILYWDGQSLSSSTADPYRAVRFSRREDAEKLAVLISGWSHEWQVVEHGFEETADQVERADAQVDSGEAVPSPHLDGDLVTSPIGPFTASDFEK